ncbi:lysophospholipid acyltransferase family protein [Candidatus Mycoplasma pogonae]
MFWLKLKKIILLPIWVVRILSVLRFARKYKKEPANFNTQMRNDYMVKKAYKFLKLYGINVKVEGYENLPKNGPALITPNHQSNMDALAMLVALKKQTSDKEEKNKIGTFIAKIELSKKRLQRSFLNIIDTFYIDRENIRQAVKTLDEFGKYVKENKTYGVIFPEGTRTKNGEIQEFKGGAFKVAKKEYLSIIPTTILNSYESDNLNKRSDFKKTITVIFHKPIKPNIFITQSNEAIAKRVKEIVASKLK